MIVHTNIEKYIILYTIMHGPQICTINKRLVQTLSSKKLLSYLPAGLFREALQNASIQTNNCPKITREQ